MRFLIPPILIVLTLVTNGGTANESAYPAYTIPADSSISIREVKKLPPFLYFDGEVEINVRYTFNYLAEASDPYVEFTISPTEESLKNLPFLIEKGSNRISQRNNHVRKKGSC